MGSNSVSPRAAVLPRVVRKVMTALRPAVFGFRRFWVHLSQPGVCVGVGTCLSEGVQFKATDGGSIVIGRNCSILRGVTLVAKGARLEIGDGSFIGPWSSVVAVSGVVMGRDCLVAERVTIRDQDHALHADRNVPIARSGMVSAPIALGDGVWLAAGSIVLKGVCVGQGAVVAANAVVTRDVPDFAIVGGVPAAVIGQRGVTGG